MKRNMIRLLSVMMAALLFTTLTAGSAATAAASKPVEPKDEGVTFYLVRHGETLFNVQGKMQGWSDAPLTEEGIHVAENLSRGLKGVPFVAAYSSTSERAMDTANIALKGRGISLITDKRLKEFNYGEWEGAKGEDILKQHPDMYTNPNVFKQAGGESTQEVIDRMKAALTDIAEKHKSTGGNVMVVAHGMATVNLLLAIDKNAWGMKPLPNSSVTTLQWKDGKFKVLKVGDMSYAEKGEKKLRFYFVRHGETLFNVQGLMQGWSDSPLTKEGIEVAKYLGKGLENVPFLAAYSSTSERAVDTGMLALGGRDLPLQLDKRLKEFNYGEWEGMKGEDVLKANPDMYTNPNVFTKAGGESTQEVVDRFKDFLKSVAAKYKDANGNIMVVSHGMSTVNLVNALDPKAWGMKPLPNSSVTIIEYENGEFHVGKVGDQSYVENGKKALGHE
ncbi:histidine phosphatase family protein [Paenibacillus guangzhouensis]|uniref:histidine phosphatase family protein n=1 Tax=Paenibacillus guangzhouensis TaxID=1473112 RepID=UPI0012677DF4|nr:histidine phosphatase family protein [Paenibacillus guangzhouensis]